MLPSNFFHLFTLSFLGILMPILAETSLAANEARAANEKLPPMTIVYKEDTRPMGDHTSTLFTKFKEL